MDRQIVYPGGIPLDTDILSIQRNTLVAIGYLAQTVLGKSLLAEGLACTPTQPGSMSVVIGPGCITQFGNVDANAFGSLPAEPNEPLVRMGINVASANFTLLAPTISGQAINYLVEASFLEVDDDPVILPYYNAANPAQPYSGPNNSGTPQNTQRQQTVQLQLKPGAPAPLGNQVTPSIDGGWAGLYVITVVYGQTVISASNIAPLAAAPFVNYKLPQLSPGTHNLAVFSPTSQGQWTVPAGITAVRLRIWGGGGAGGNGFGGAGGGGSGGGYSEGYYSVVPGQIIAVTVGAGAAGVGTSGGTSSFGSIASASGGQSGSNGSAGVGGTGANSTGSGFGSGLVLPGASGGDAIAVGSNWIGGHGGHAHSSAGALAVIGAGSGAIAGRVGPGPGAGASGGVGTGSGGSGGPGLVLVEW